MRPSFAAGPVRNLRFTAGALTNLRRLAPAAILLLARFPVAARAEDLPTHTALNLPFAGYGISIGNSARHSGLRFNWSDDGIEKINGLNVTLWVPGEPLSGTMNGVGIGLGVMGAGEINGLSFGLGGVFGEHALNGISIGGLAIITSGDAAGVTFSGFGVVASGSLTGFNFGGVGCVAGGNMNGASVGPLGLVATGSLSGLNLAGLAAVSGGAVAGLNASIGAVVAKGDIAGLSITAGAIQTAGDVAGFTVAGFRTKSDRVTGIDLNVLTTDVRCATGLVTGLYNNVSGRQEGISIGLLNRTSSLFGVQIGLVNIAENNPEGFRALPFLNVHF